ncbi:MAG: zinc-ribbon domain-containing protein [Hyphomicrobiaceae bacterium]|nr:zinc-ribbon domain-containing protein [Hyphomicrobiaceae bacterium]
MIIVCPNCNARYELAAKALGDAGRKVQCANCKTSWRAFPEPEPKQVPEPKPAPVTEPKPQARPKAVPVAASGNAAVKEDDSLFDALAEAELDEIFEQEASKARPAGDPHVGADGEAAGPAIDAAGSASGSAAAEPPKEDNATLMKRREALQKRHEVLARNLPHSKFRRWFRMSAAVLLMTLFLGLFMFRESLVWAFPELAGLYRMAGIEVNVVGIEFRRVNTVRALRDGVETLMINADLVNVANRQVKVPRVRVELIGADGNLLYEWNATPQARVLRPSESVEFTTQLASPPLDAVDMRLGFVEGSNETARP